MPLLLLLALNEPSTARASTARVAGGCVRLGLVQGGAHGLVALRPGEHVAVCGGGAATGPGLVAVTAPGLAGTLRSPETRVDGLVGAHAVSTGSLRGGGHANVPALRARLEKTRASALRLRVVLATILIALALFAPRRAIMAGPAAIAGALLLSALDWTSLTLFALLTLLGSLLPWRALWVFFAAYLVVLVASPETQSLALLGPHPWGGGRFYGISNELETLLLAPALVLGLAAAPLVLLTIGWSRAGADGGGLLVYLAAYARLVPRPRLAAAGVVALAVAFVAVDAATGGSSHVTHSVLHGNVLHDLWHRWGVSWRGATGAWGRGLVSAASLLALVVLALRRPRKRLVDAFLIGIAVSLVANDTPQDVLFWGAISGVALRRAV
jgi:hypothetical protein